MVNRGLEPLCLFIAIFPSALCVLIVSIRVWMRTRAKLFGLEDTLLALATFMNLILTFTASGYILSAHYGYHASDIPRGTTDPILEMKWNYANSIIYNPILALVKASFLWTLIKLRSSNKWINHCLWMTLIWNGCFALATPIVSILQCIPIKKAWDSAVPGKCINGGAYNVSTSAIVLATDVLILVMPTWILHDLNMPFGRKLMVIAFLSFSVVVTIVGAFRTKAMVTGFVLTEPNPDPKYGIGFTLSNLESSLGIIGTCGPTIKYLLGFCIPALKISDDSSNHAYAYPPTGVSKGASRSRRHTKGARTTDTFKEVEGNSSGGLGSSVEVGSDDDVELAQVVGHGRTRSDNGRANSEEQMIITKTVAWTLKSSRPESNHTCEQTVSTPHNMV